MRKYVLSIVAAICFVVAITSVHAVTVHEATGKGAFIDNDGNSVSLQFKAGVDDEGTIFWRSAATIPL